MGQLTPVQRRRRQQAESLIRLMAPVLNAVLVVGERISRIAEPEDSEYYPPRVTREDEASPDAPWRAGS